ncbi:carboxymuconolactone decarboxylase family protein [Dyella japonica]|uniref:Alkylhydroperoxidase n=1 Tax=Dyella japonica DSM 16301 TaxID=1440762 RepID=A0A0G9H543_9GAMM|nr:carboxymuconolactone decarboxylase family protein [Dyella japonica]KLD62822.1 alkylhydroperoxidase [Dyella japonica DSM 16301]
MNRLTTLTNLADAPEASAALFAGIKKAMGKVPNAYAAVGSSAPNVLAHVLQTNAVLKQGELSALELEAINLAVSEASQCDYCLAAHTMTGKMAGYTAEQIQQLRKGGLEGNPKIDALAKFALTLVTTSNTLSAEAVASVKNAGYTDRQILEAILAISAILFTNMVNRVNDTVLDFPKAA